MECEDIAIHSNLRIRMIPIARILVSIIILALSTACVSPTKVRQPDSKKVVLRSIDMGQIDIQPDLGRLQYGGKFNPDNSFTQRSQGHLLEDNQDLYVLFEEGDGTRYGMYPFVYGIKSKKVRKLKRAATAISVKKLAELNNMKALTMIEPQRRSRCLEMTDKNPKLESAHCWNNPLMPARHGISAKHQYYVTSTNGITPESANAFTIEYVDYSDFGVKTNYIEDIVDAIESRKKVLSYRDENTFDGYLAAFAISSDFSDLESAQFLAKSQSQKSKLSNAMATASKPSKQLVLKKVANAQTALKYGGYYEMAIDGIYGPGSIKALKEFQTDSNLPVNGKLDSRTIRQLNKFKKNWVNSDNWRTIGESSLSKRINGKTLVASHMALCHDKDAVIPCTKIALLSKKSRGNRINGQYKATIIDPQLKEIQQHGWGTASLLNQPASAFNIGLIEIRRESGNFLQLSRITKLENAVSINTKSDMLKIQLHDYPQQHLIVGIEDSGAEYLADAKRRNYRDINTIGKPISNAPPEKLVEKVVVKVSKTGGRYNDFDKYDISCSHKSNNEVVWFNTKTLYWENKALGFIPRLYGEKNFTAPQVASYICSR